MPDTLTQVLATPGLVFVVLAIAMAGLVHGFAGFGSSLIFVPVAAQFLPLPEVVVVLVLTGLVTVAALVPRAWHDADRAEIGFVVFAALLALPVGVYALTRLDQVLMRWFVSFVAAGTLLAVCAGWRYSGQLDKGGLATVGAAAGLLGGMTGLTGPVMILFNLAGGRSAATMRANMILFLAALDVALVVALAVSGQVTWPVVVMSGVLCIPFLLTLTLGQALFRPELERLYRGVAYGVIALAVLSGLPLFD